MSTAPSTRAAKREEEKDHKLSPAVQTKNVVVPLAVGMLFGSAFQLSRVHELYFVRSQMLMDRFLMLKMFLSAAATSMTVLAVLPMVSRRARVRVEAKVRSASESVGESRGVPAVVVGAAMIGVGMALTGSCPATVFAQIASGSVAARYVLLGGLLGGTAVPLAELLLSGPGWAALQRKGRSRLQALTLDKVAGVTSPTAIALPLAAALVAFVGALEWVAPWRGELDALAAAAAAGGAKGASGSIPFAIPPYVAGAVVGLLQLPLVMLLDKQLGSSGCYASLVGEAARPLLGARLRARMPSLAAARSSSFQVLVMAGVSLGAFLCSSFVVSGGAAYLSNALPASSLVSPAEGIFGGFLLVAGARLAGGCTSGHGLSGFGLLSLNSVMAVASMFSAGMATAFMLYR